MKPALSTVPSYRSRSSDAVKPLLRPAWLSERVWPFKTSTLRVDGCDIALTDVGEGPTLLFVHTGFWSFVWRDVIKRLQPDFRCIAFDAPGTGQSQRLPLSAISLNRAANVVKAVIETLDLNDVTLVVHDLGGPSGIAGAARVSSQVQALVGVNTFAWKPSGALFRGMLGLMGSGAMREFDGLTQILARVSAGNFGVGRHFDEPSRAAFRAGIGRAGLRTFHQYLHDARGCDALYEEVGAALSGPFRGLPLVTIFGERNDPLGFQPMWKQMFPEALQVVVAKGNHFPMCDDPELVADTIARWHRERVARE